MIVAMIIAKIFLAIMLLWLLWNLFIELDKSDRPQKAIAAICMAAMLFMSS